ncbi:SID1 transmembrane family member 1 [Caerostris extrusa]|uniref:SID1 transmembrane family member 1 n=1 Tax=Caerostris extrusa TaxID=172846 RepID=A0AAV4QEP0_CAEEX|nr:SID1 transmembrane family member 1 [Caerostris extrusa]
MAPVVNSKQLLLLLAYFVFTDYVLSNTLVQASNKIDPECDCTPQTPEINKQTKGRVKSDCPKCFVYTYEFLETQDWAARMCVRSTGATASSPMFIVIRESLNVMSFQLPVTFPQVRPYDNACRTLCPLANYNDKNLKASLQNISIEISTSSQRYIDFDFRLSNETDFMLTKDVEVNITITPSQPFIMQYNMENSLRAARIEANSEQKSCMLLAIQDIQCPIHDTVELIEPQGYYQTLLQKSGISITEKTFKGGRQYVVLLMKPTDASCIDFPPGTSPSPENRQKQVSLRVVPAITDKEYYQAVRRRNTTESQTVNVESPRIQTYGTSSDSESASENTSRSIREFSVPPLNASPISIDETDMDKLPDAEVDKNIVRTKTIVFVSDLSRKKEKYLSDRTKVYSWNLLTVAVFYGLPVIQLVYINQRIVNMTGNQDLCYYNFLCSHKVGVFSDFNHVYSNIGYVMLGILFLLLVWRRDTMDKYYEAERRDFPSIELTGIPRHYGLLYAMGWALIMEGVLSGSYHVCPNRANFQFDTAFMYVISTVCILKLYQSRHPDITVKSHITWMILAVVIIIGFGGVVNKGGLLVWIPFFFAHLAVTFIVSAKIYYMGRVKIDRWIWKRMYQKAKLDYAARSVKPVYMESSLFGLIKQPPNFGAFLLAVFIANLLMYLIYYSIMKIRYKERIRWMPYMYMILSFICWGAALHFFFGEEYILADNTSRISGEK